MTAWSYPSGVNVPSPQADPLTGAAVDCGRLGRMPKIQQIIPAVGWYAVYQQSDRAVVPDELVYRPLVAWALLPQEPEQAAAEPDDQVVGLVVDQTGLVTEVDETDEAFEGYQQRG